MSQTTLENIHGYDTILWDLRNSQNILTIGGIEGCPHEHLDKDCRCACGALHGKLHDFTYADYAKWLLTQLSISSAKNTIIFSRRSLMNSKFLLNFTRQPRYSEIVWLSKLGALYDKHSQSVTYLISKTEKPLSTSRFCVNTRGFDERLLTLGRTLCIGLPDKWRIVSPLVDYI